MEFTNFRIGNEISRVTFENLRPVGGFIHRIYKCSFTVYTYHFTGLEWDAARDCG